MCQYSLPGQKNPHVTFAEPRETLIFVMACCVEQGCTEASIRLLSPPALQQQNPRAAPLPRPTHSTVSDERVTQLGDFIPRQRHFGQEDLPALDHDFFALGVVLAKSGMRAERPRAAAAAAAGPGGRPLPSTPAR